MNITVLGGAAACPNPGQGCSSYLVSHGSASLLLDCGPDTLSVLRSVADYRAIDAIIISHTHADHTLDLIPYRYGLRYEPGRDRHDAHKVPLWMPPGGTPFLAKLGAALAHGDEESIEFFESTFRISEYAADRDYQVGPFTLRFVPTFHAIPCWAVRVEGSGKSLTYLADSSFHPSLIDFAGGSNVLICEGTLLESDEDSSTAQQTHMTAAQAGMLAAASGVDQLILTHLWSAFGFAAYEAEARSHFDGTLHIAKPGLVVPAA